MNRKRYICDANGVKDQEHILWKRIKSSIEYGKKKLKN